jgi:LPXTG-site transpeptidase (sortase) family protein
MAAALAGGALTACLATPRDDSSGDALPDAPGMSTSVPASSAATSDPTPGATGDAALPSLRAAPATQAGDGVGPAPTRVVVARLDIDMAVEPQGVLPDGEMALPSSPEVAGWYRFGRAPDDPAGATVLAAHVDSKTGIGPFVRLGRAQAGDEVDVWVGGERHAYRVTQVVRVDKAKVHVDDLFAMGGPPRLHLVTCTGDYVKGSGYTQNLVVIADRM